MQILVQEVCGGGQDSAFPTSFQTMPQMLRSVDFEQHLGAAFLAYPSSCPGTSMACIPMGTLTRGWTCITHLSTQAQLPSGQVQKLLWVLRSCCSITLLTPDPCRHLAPPTAGSLAIAGEAASWGGLLHSLCHQIVSVQSSALPPTSWATLDK